MVGTILKNVLSFTGLALGVPTALPHSLTVNGISVAPQLGGFSASGFTATANATNVIVTRLTAAISGDVNVYVERWHTIEDVLPLPGQLAGLVPFFFGNDGGGGGGGGTSVSSPPFWWTCTEDSEVEAHTMLITDFGPTYTAMRPGSFVGVQFAIQNPITEGSCTVRIQLNGSPVLEVAGSPDVNPSGGTATAPVGTVPYLAGDVIGMRFVVAGGFVAGDESVVTGWIQVVEAA